VRGLFLLVGFACDQQFFVFNGKMRGHRQLLHPFIRYLGQRCIKIISQLLNQRGERIAEIFILTTSKAIPLHINDIAVKGIVRIKTDKGFTRFVRQDFRYLGKPFGVKTAGDRGPIQCADVFHVFR